MVSSLHIKTSGSQAARFINRLGPHHFAYLRAVAQGIALDDCARRYLPISHGHEVITAHRQVVDAVRAVARRHGESAWRLIGLTIRSATENKQPTLEDFIAERALDGWSEQDICEMYVEAYPVDRKLNRRQKLLEQQMALLRRMESLAAESPSPTDLISGWFDEVMAAKIIAAGMLTLGDLNRKIAAGGRWYAALPAIGEVKARRIVSYLATLLPQERVSVTARFTLKTGSSGVDTSDGVLALGGLSQLDTGLGLRGSPVLGREQSDQSLAGKLLQANTDQEAVDAWVAARAGSLATTRVYRREAHRLLLWLQLECQGKTLGTMQIGDCRDYMAFLQHIPDLWISRQKAAPGQVGWAPFRGQLSHKSQRQAVVIIAGLFTWLASAQYIQANPWILVNQKTGDDKAEKMLDSKAFSEAALTEVLNFIEAQEASPSRERMLFVLRFLEAVGLRSSELLGAKLKDLRLEPEGWMLQVHGKGAKNRIAAIPGQALEALQDYLDARHLGSIQTVPPDAPLLASALDPMEPIGYQSLYETVRSWIFKAVAASQLPTNERLRLARASTHWLRHTFGTRAVAREVPMDVIQAQMGHASMQTTTAIYGRAPMKRRADELQKAFK